METDKILIANVLGKAKESYNKNIVTSTFFLDMRQLKIVQNSLNREGFKYEVVRLNEEMEKVILLFLPTYLKIEDIDLSEYIAGIKLSIKKGQKLQHRDYMGAIYNSGVKKECIGDIFVYEDFSACVFCLPNIAEYLKYNLLKIGKYEVKIDIVNPTEVQLPQHLFQILEINVPSNRIDNIASETSKISRNKIVEKIINKEIFVNYELIQNKSIALNEGDVFSIRGVGKFRLIEFLGKSRKGNLIYSVKKYI